MIRSNLPTVSRYILKSYFSDSNVWFCVLVSEDVLHFYFQIFDLPPTKKPLNFILSSLSTGGERFLFSLPA